MHNDNAIPRVTTESCLQLRYLAYLLKNIVKSLTYFG